MSLAESFFHLLHVDSSVTPLYRLVLVASTLFSFLGTYFIVIFIVFFSKYSVTFFLSGKYKTITYCCLFDSLVLGMFWASVWRRVTPELVRIWLNTSYEAKLFFMNTIFLFLILDAVILDFFTKEKAEVNAIHSAGMNGVACCLIVFIVTLSIRYGY
jgi:hypothetical protein